MSENIGTVYDALYALGGWSTLQDIKQAAGLSDIPDQRALQLVQVLTGQGTVERMDDPETGTVRYRVAGGDGSE